jgi:hypothetical protein
MCIGWLVGWLWPNLNENSGAAARDKPGIVAAAATMGEAAKVRKTFRLEELNMMYPLVMNTDRSLRVQEIP